MWRYSKGNNRNCCVLTLPGGVRGSTTRGDTYFGVPLPIKRTPGTHHRPNPNSVNSLQRRAQEGIARIPSEPQPAVFPIPLSPISRVQFFAFFYIFFKKAAGSINSSVFNT